MPIRTACCRSTNLMDNAIKFTPADGSVMVKAFLVEADPTFVYISVVDTGQGISPEAKGSDFRAPVSGPESQ